MKDCCFCMSPIGEDARFCPACGKKQNGDFPTHHLTPGTVLNDRYIVGIPITDSGSGTTYLGRDELCNTKVSIKEYRPLNCAGGETYEKGKQHFLKEATTLMRFKGEAGIVNVFDCFENNNTAYAVMEYVDGKSLASIADANGRFSPCVTLSIMLPVMESLKNMHAQGFIYRDVSPDTIIVTQDAVKLKAFGPEIEMIGCDDDLLFIVLATRYSAEERFQGEDEQGPWTDVYGLCTTMFRCITGRRPIDAFFPDETEYLIMPSELGITIDHRIEDAIMKGMSVHRRDRHQSIGELMSAFNESKEELVVPLDQAIRSITFKSVPVPDYNAFDGPGVDDDGPTLKFFDVDNVTAGKIKEATDKIRSDLS